MLPPKRCSGGFRSEHNMFRMWQEGEAVFGQRRLPRGAMEKPGAEFSLESGQFGASSRRCETQVACCGTDAVQLGDAYEKVQNVNVHEMTFKVFLKLILKRERYRNQSR